MGNWATVAPLELRDRVRVEPEIQAFWEESKARKKQAGPQGYGVEVMGMPEDENREMVEAPIGAKLTTQGLSEESMATEKGWLRPPPVKPDRLERMLPKGSNSVRVLLA